jgi:hypothetical protein
MLMRPLTSGAYELEALGAPWTPKYKVSLGPAIPLGTMPYGQPNQTADPGLAAIRLNIVFQKLKLEFTLWAANPQIAVYWTAMTRTPLGF